MQIEVADELQAQAIAAGYATAEDYVAALTQHDADRVAILQGIDDWKAGRVQDFDEFDRKLRSEFGFAPRG